MEQFDLATLIPDERFHKRYVARNLGDMSDVEMLELAVKNKFNCLLQGPTGPGKTSLYLATCAKNGWPLGTANLNGQTTVEDLVGQIVPVPTDPGVLQQLRDVVVNARASLLQAKFDQDHDKVVQSSQLVWRAELALQEATQHGAELEWVDGLLVRLMRGDPRFPYTVFLADEVNFAPAKVMALLNGVTDDRRQIAIVQHKGETVVAHDGFHFGAAMNPAYEGTRNLNKAFKDRFPIQLFFDYDPEVEKQLVSNASLLEMVGNLRKMYNEGELHTPTSTRALMQYERLETIFGSRLARECFISHYEEDEQQALRDTMELHLGKGVGRSTTPLGDASV